MDNKINEENIIVCRCCDVNLKEIKDLINQGNTKLDEIKRLSRAGMGQCQGKTCRNLIMQELGKLTNIKQDEIEIPKNRPPIVTIPINSILEENKNEK
jgi:bacterioferritin-associated ferredoxin